jgi:hypothetical protein
VRAADRLEGVAEWAWARHHNVLSWYVRPLFLLPLAWSAHRRSPAGIAVTLVALATSMAWFPPPARVDPRVAEFLRFEREWLTGDWDGRKVLLTGLVPLSLTGYCLAFWRRSPGWGLVLLNAMAAGKVLWAVLSGRGTGWAMLAPAGAGLLVGDVVLVVAVRSRRGRRASRSAAAAA